MHPRLVGIAAPQTMTGTPAGARQGPHDFPVGNTENKELGFSVVS
jgi:hypothetical protein